MPLTPDEVAKHIDEVLATRAKKDRLICVFVTESTWARWASEGKIMPDIRALRNVPVQFFDEDADPDTWGFLWDPGDVN